MDCEVSKNPSQRVAAMNGGFGAGDQKGCANGASNYTFIERAVERVKKDVMVYRLEIYKTCGPHEYGVDCKETCTCNLKGSHGAKCDDITGRCHCREGYSGANCQHYVEACGPHEYGVDCKETCTCNLKGSHGAKCDDITGRCHCREGYSGANCQHYVEAEANHPDNTVKSNTFPTDAHYYEGKDKATTTSERKQTLELQQLNPNHTKH
ncbi:MEGF6-like protein [Mya arenaria]|uniref:MEGF6-like protein n=1 Tax=Mya arenaria TaxID=6604 RepID=A0ABY7F9H9_MYAAR|nr:MEGF6-like protein [Mya arenaria]